MLKADNVLIEKFENFVKSSNRNRCQIAGPNGLQLLSIPIESGRSHRQYFTDVHASYAEDWQKNHWQSLTSSYRRSPYFEFYEYELEDLFLQKAASIYTLNSAIIERIFSLLKLNIEVTFTNTYEISYSDFFDARKLYKEKKYAPIIPSYIQVFGDRHPFLNDISILDLLFNQGPTAREYLMQLSKQIDLEK